LEDGDEVGTEESQGVSWMSKMKRKLEDLECLNLEDWVLYRGKIYEIIFCIDTIAIGPTYGQNYIGVNVETKKTYKVRLDPRYGWTKVPKGNVETLKLLYL